MAVWTEKTQQSETWTNKTRQAQGWTEKTRQSETWAGQTRTRGFDPNGFASTPAFDTGRAAGVWTRKSQ